MDVPPALTFDDRFHVLTRLVEIASVLDDLSTQRPHRRVLVRIVPHRNDNAAGDAKCAAGERNRLTVVARTRRDHASAPFIVRELRDEVQATANLERAGWIVVLVFHPHGRPDPLVEQRVTQER
jgi:hypothetical protein